MNALPGEFNAAKVGVPRRVLVLESDRLLRELIVEWLGLSGNLPRAAPDLAAAAQLLPSFDLVLVDLPAPHRAALGLIQRLIQLLPDTPIIAMSADIPSRGPEALDALARQLGAEAILVKPFTQHALLSAIQSIRA